MINLLPVAYKSEIRAARTNVVLIRYGTILAIAFGFLILILFGSMFLLSFTRKGSDEVIAVNATNAAKYQETSEEIKSLSATLSTSQTVLDNQISYTKVLQSIAAAMPKGTVIGEVDLNDTSFDGSKPTVLQVYAVDNDTAVKVGQIFQTTPGFSNGKIESISEGSGVVGYPFSATLTVTLSRSLGK